MNQLVYLLIAVCGICLFLPVTAGIFEITYRISPVFRRMVDGFINHVRQ